MNKVLTQSSFPVRKHKFYLQHRERQLDLKALMLLTCICSIFCAKNAPAMIAVNIETLHSTFGSFETKSRVNVCFYLLVPSSSLLKALVAGMEPFWKKKETAFCIGFCKAWDLFQYFQQIHGKLWKVNISGLGQHTKCIAFLDDLNNWGIFPPLIMSAPSNLMSGLFYFRTICVQLTDLSGEGGHRVEVCEVEVVDLLLRRGRHRPTSLQHHPHPQVPLLHLQVTQF